MPTPRDLLAVCEHVAYEGDPVTPEDLDIDQLDVHEALALYRKMQQQTQAARVAEKTVGRHLAALLGEGGAIRMGPQIVRYRKGYTERCIDPDGFAAALRAMVKAGAVDAGNLTNPNSVRKTAIPPILRSTFFEKVDDPEPALTITPLDRAPKFLQGLDDGAVWGPA